MLTRSIEPERWIGRPLDLDRDARLYASATIAGVGWQVHAGADRAQALAATRALNRREVTIILAGLLLFLLADGGRAPARRAPARPARQRGARRDGRR